jgi:predicted glycosyltransferase
MEEFSFSLNFIPLKKVSGIKEMIDIISYNQENEVLENIGLEYQNTLGNLVMIF